HLWVLDGGMENRGVRPVNDGKDSLYEISAGAWYGWPDFEAGNKISSQSLLSEFPSTPPKPHATFDLNQISYLIVSPDRFFQNTAIAQVADNKLQSLNLTSNNLNDFTTLPGKVIQMKFGPDDKLYVLVSIDDKTTKLFSIES